MKIDILTIFPDMFKGFLTQSIIKRAIEKKLVDINIINFRNYSKDKNHKVDDIPYGGGSGMVLTCQPIFDCVASIKTTDSYIILLTPDGKTYNQTMAETLKDKKHLIIICGHYEGFDDRIRMLADLEISVGDFILTGGELASMIITDSITRLIDGVISDGSLESESFTSNLLDYPVYTKPRSYKGLDVPDVLLNGDHKKIDEYRKSEQLRITKEKRKDLLK